MCTVLDGFSTWKTDAPTAARAWYLRAFNVAPGVATIGSTPTVRPCWSRCRAFRTSAAAAALWGWRHARFTERHCALCAQPSSATTPADSSARLAVSSITFSVPWFDALKDVQSLRLHSLTHGVLNQRGGIAAPARRSRRKVHWRRKPGPRKFTCLCGRCRVSRKSPWVFPSGFGCPLYMSRRSHAAGLTPPLHRSSLQKRRGHCRFL